MPQCNKSERQPPWLHPRSAYIHIPFCAHHCCYCDFDRVCPGGRGERWVKLREHPSLKPYVELAEGEP